MAFHEDVLEHLGKTPREYGSLQLCAAPAVRDREQRVRLTVWLQAAFSPVAPGARLLIGARTANGAVLPDRAAIEVPTLGDDGAVIRWELPLTLPDPDITHLLLELDSTVAERARRVRQAWKLSQTVEVPKESELKPLNDPLEINLGRTLVGTALLGGAGVVISFRGAHERGAGLAQASSSKWHAAQTLPPVEVAIELGEIQSDEESVERIWRPGEPLPTPQAALPPVPTWNPPARTVPPTSGVRRHSCGFFGPMSDYAGDRFCPTCGEPWD